MRIRALIALTAAAGAIAFAGSGCGTSSPAAIGPLANAAHVTAQAGGAHMQLTARIEASSIPGTVTMTGGGYFNYLAREGKMSLTLTGRSSALGSAAAPTIEEIYKGGDVYIGSSLFAGRLPGGAKWMKLDVARVAQAAGIDPSQLLGGQSNPAEFLEYLKASGSSVTNVGTESVRGVPTTHYRGTVELGRVAGVLSGANRNAVQKALAQLGASSLPVDVWVDSHKLVRRLGITLSAPAGGQNLQMQMEMELFSFGATPTVTAPSAAETFDATSTTLSGLRAIGG
jgi:hypothetical protein